MYISNLWINKLFWILKVHYVRFSKHANQQAPACPGPKLPVLAV